MLEESKILQREIMGKYKDKIWQIVAYKNASLQFELGSTFVYGNLENVRMLAPMMNKHYKIKQYKGDHATIKGRYIYDAVEKINELHQPNKSGDTVTYHDSQWICTGFGRDNVGIKPFDGEKKFVDVDVQELYIPQCKIETSSNDKSWISRLNRKQYPIESNSNETKRTIEGDLAFIKNRDDVTLAIVNNFIDGNFLNLTTLLHEDKIKLILSVYNKEDKINGLTYIENHLSTLNQNTEYLKLFLHGTRHEQEALNDVFAKPNEKYDYTTQENIDKVYSIIKKLLYTLYQSIFNGTELFNIETYKVSLELFDIPRTKFGTKKRKIAFLRHATYYDGPDQEEVKELMKKWYREQNLNYSNSELAPNVSIIPFLYLMNEKQKNAAIDQEISRLKGRFEKLEEQEKHCVDIKYIEKEIKIIQKEYKQLITLQQKSLPQ